MTDDDPIAQAAFDALMSMDLLAGAQAKADAVLAAVTPLIRAQTLRDHAAWLRAQYPEDAKTSRAASILSASMHHAATIAEHRADQEQP